MSGLSKTALARRHKYLGASDVPAVIGVSPWQSASDVYYKKVAEFEKEEKMTKAMEAGIRCEPVLLDFAEERLGKIRRNQFRVHPDVPWASATLDAICIDKANEGVEAKTARNPQHWGEEGTDQIPIYYLAQVQWQMYITGFSVIHVPLMTFDFGFEFRMYTVERDEAVIESIVASCTAFWEENVLKKNPPKDTIPAPTIVQNMKRVPEKVTTVDESLVREYKEATEALKLAKKAQQDAKTRMLEDLGDAEVGKYSGGVINYFQRSRKGHTVKVKPSTYRSLEIKEGDGDDLE